MSDPTRVEALGELAASVAHDINNLLFVIVSHVESVEQMPGVTPAMRQEIAVVLRACTKATTLTRRLLTVTRDLESDTRQVSVNELLDTVLRLLRRVLPASIRIRLDAGTDLDPIVADAVQIEQVITNLCSNARDAMPEGGTIMIETAKVAAVDPYRHRYSDLGDGPWVRLTIRDSGLGMRKEVALRALEPFFTTKTSAHEGSGLGLSIVQRIVRRHGGIIRIESQPGAGTAVHVFLPTVPSI
jgi:signal transduction histidine kinase